MSKYEPLTAFLKQSSGHDVRVSFLEIEDVLGFPLPASKKYPAWWSNSATNNAMTNAWLAAGYKTGQVDVVGEKVTFLAEVRPNGASPATGSSSRSPLFGSMKGTTFVMPGVDLTAPTLDEAWLKKYESYDPTDVLAQHEVLRILSDGKLNISDKIRALNDFGVPRAQIAKVLGKRYQHVRNVLMAQELKAKSSA